MKKQTEKEPREDSSTVVERAAPAVPEQDASEEVLVAEQVAARLDTSIPRTGGVEIPFDELGDNGFIHPNLPRSRTAEEFRGIKRPLLRNIRSMGDGSRAPTNLVMVTSALQGDGKTFTSINLAISIAMEQDKTVLFVDADVVRGTAGRRLGVPKASPGLIDLLTGSGVTPQDVILDTNMPKLRVLPAGRPDERATELLASEEMHALMIEMAERYHDRVIIFDSPPLLLTTESGVLSSFMGQIVFVAAADITPQSAVQEAMEHIGEDRIVGVVLNRVSRRRSRLFGLGSYSYGYGYGYGHYDHAASAEEASG